MIDFTSIRGQSEFCLELMIRLNRDIQSENRESAYSPGALREKDRKQDDARRLRRELLKLIERLEAGK